MTEPEPKPPTFFEMVCVLAVHHRRALRLAALMVVPAWFGGGALIMAATHLGHRVWPPIAALDYGAALVATIAIWSLRWGVRWVIAVVPPGGHPGRVLVVPGPGATHYTGWQQPLRVTLTATANPYLRDRLPLTGLARVHEMRTDDYAMRKGVSFQETTAEGTLLGPPVMVDDAAFIYEPPARTE